MKTLYVNGHGLRSGQRTLVSSLLVTFVGLASLLTPMTSHAIEEPAYAVIEKLQDVEIREYAPFTVAEVVVAGDHNAAGNAAFPILAGYIFGKNKGERKFAMTAPVTQAAIPVKMEMTAPVTQTAVQGGFLVQFVLPNGVTVANAPEPLDPRIALREEPARRIAVLQYSGFWSDANFNKHLAQLQSTLRGANLKWTGEPVLSRYNAPFTPWFMRRNEVWLLMSKAP